MDTESSGDQSLIALATRLTQVDQDSLRTRTHTCARAYNATCVTNVSCIGYSADVTAPSSGSVSAASAVQGRRSDARTATKGPRTIRLRR